MSDRTRTVVRQGSVSLVDRHMEVSMGMNMQSLCKGASLNEVCGNPGDRVLPMGGGGVAEGNSHTSMTTRAATRHKNADGMLSGGVWGMWVWSAGDTGTQGWPVVAGNAGISAIGSEFNVASLDGFVDVNKYVGFEMNSSKTKDGVSLVSAIDCAAFFTDSNRKDTSGGYNEEKIKQASKVPGKRVENGPVCMRCEVCSSLLSRPVEEVTTTVSQNVWGNRRHSVSYLHGRAGSKKTVTLCAFGMRGKRAPQKSGGGVLGGLTNNNNNNSDDDTNDYSNNNNNNVEIRDENKGDENKGDENKKKKNARFRTYVPHVQMNMTPMQGSWKVRDVMWGQAIGNDCTVKCHSKGCGSNICISSSLKIRNAAIQHDIAWRERSTSGDGQDTRQYVLSKVSGKIHLVLPKSAIKKCQKSVLGTKVCWSLGNTVDCTLSYTRQKCLKFNVSISKSPEKRAALQFGIQSGDL